MRKPGFHYSGEDSKEFWKRILAIKPKATQDVMFLMGCALQDHEERMHQALQLAERKPTSSKAAGK